MLQQCLGIAIPSPWGGLGKGFFFSQSHKDRKGLTHSHTSRSFLCFLCVAARSSRLLSLRNLCDLSVFASESSPLAVITPPSPLGEGQGVRLNRFFGIAVIEGVIAVYLATVSIEAVVLKVLIDMASVVLACVQAFLCCKLFVSCVHSSLVLVIIQCFLFCEYTKKSETLYFLSHISFIFYVFLS